MGDLFFSKNCDCLPANIRSWILFPEEAHSIGFVMPKAGKLGVANRAAGAAVGYGYPEHAINHQ